MIPKPTGPSILPCHGVYLESLGKLQLHVLNVVRVPKFLSQSSHGVNRHKTQAVIKISARLEKHWEFVWKTSLSRDKIA